MKIKEQKLIACLLKKMMDRINNSTKNSSKIYFNDLFSKKYLEGKKSFELEKDNEKTIFHRFYEKLNVKDQSLFLMLPMDFKKDEKIIHKCYENILSNLSSDSLSINYDFSLFVIKNLNKNIRDVFLEIQNDFKTKELCLEYVKKDEEFIYDLPYKFNPFRVKNIEDGFNKEMEEFMIEAIKVNPLIFNKISKDFEKCINSKIISALTKGIKEEKKNGGTIKIITSRLLSSPTVIKNLYETILLKNVPMSLKTEEVCLDFISFNESNIQYIPKNFMKNNEFLLKAFEVNSTMIKFLDNNYVKENPDFIYKAIEGSKGKTSTVLYTISSSGKQSILTEDMCLKAIKINRDWCFSVDFNNNFC